MPYITSVQVKYDWVSRSENNETGQGRQARLSVISRRHS